VLGRVGQGLAGGADQRRDHRRRRVAVQLPGDQLGVEAAPQELVERPQPGGEPALPRGVRAQDRAQRGRLLLGGGADLAQPLGGCGVAIAGPQGDRLQAVTLLRQGVPPPRGAARQAPERRRPGGGGRRAGRPGSGTTSTSPTGSSTPRCASAAATRQHAGLLGLLAELRGAGPDGEGTPATLGKLKERLSRQ
jgi:hypothetical protein